MALKNILVHIESVDDSQARLTLATQLASDHEAHLTGLYRVPEIDPRLYMSPDLGLENLDEATSDIEIAAAAAKQAFETAVAAAGVSAEWRSAGGHFADLSEAAHYADLIITGQAAPGRGGPVAESFVLASGRPSIVVPQVGIRSTALRRVLVAWTETREASRAVHDALPILERADHVMALCVAHRAEEVERARTASVTLCHHLARHGVKAEAGHDTLGRDIDVADVILSRCADLQSDLVVMGAYGHSKLREMVLGGATRGLFEHMTVPVLMAH